VTDELAIHCQGILTWHIQNGRRTSTSGVQLGWQPCWTPAQPRHCQTHPDKPGLSKGWM